MTRRAKSNLYVLRHVDTGEIYAISEFQAWITLYLELFEGYFDAKDINKKEYQIDILTDSFVINKYLDKYPEYNLSPRGIDDKLVLTEWEWDYYGPVFRRLYERMKDTIINLKMFQELYEFNFIDKESSIPKEFSESVKGNTLEIISNQLYDISCDYDTFVQHLPLSFIQTKILLEPIKAHKFNQYLTEINQLYYKHWYCDD